MVLPVVRIAAAAGAPPEPVLYLGPGPGRRAIDPGGLDRQRFPWLGGRGLVLVEPRGTGGAWPSLACPDLRRALLGEVDGGRQTLRAVSHGELADLVAACRDRLAAAGVDLAAYGREEGVADLVDLRRALGIARWDLVADGAGTALALGLLRADGGAVRAAALDGVRPPHLDYGADGAAARFAAVTGCVNGFGEDWRAMAEKTRRRLAGTPERVVWTDTFLFKRTFAVTLGPDMFTDLVRTALTRMGDKHYVCEILVKAAEEVYDDLLAPFLVWMRDRDAATAAAELSAACGDGLVPPPAGVPVGLLAALAVPRLQRFCDLWPRRASDPAALAPVRSAVPVLLLSDTFDPTAPPLWAEHQATLLSRGFHVALAAGRAGAAARKRCAPLAIAAFLDDPQRRPAPDCLKSGN